MTRDSEQFLPVAQPWNGVTSLTSALAKTTQSTQEQEESRWRDLSLTLAIRSMEDEDAPQYTKADLKVIFS